MVDCFFLLGISVTIIVLDATHVAVLANIINLCYHMATATYMALQTILRRKVRELALIGQSW